MNIIHHKINDGTQITAIETELNGSTIVLDHRGIMYLPDSQTLIVSDLHLEKGAAFARRGFLHPPYDTKLTLNALTACIKVYDPKVLISLGDSFHDVDGSLHLPDMYHQQLVALQAGREWIWISGNHDAEPPKDLEGQFINEYIVETLTCRHEPSKDNALGEISGHLHPAAVISRRGKSVRRSCFATDGSRLIMPAFGATTGGLSLSHKAFHGLFDPKNLYAHILGKDRIYPVHALKMRG